MKKSMSTAFTSVILEWCVVLVLSINSSSAMDFFDVRPPDSTITAQFGNSSIAWRPQGDYALLVSTRIYYPECVGIHRFDFGTNALTYQDYIYPQYHFERVGFHADGSFALITGGEHLYRYDHSENGFGSVTEIVDIENPGGCVITFFDVLRHPVSPSEPMYILANLACGSSHHVNVLRYDPSSSPQVYVDVSGGIGPSDSSAFEPWTGAWQADGDYMVWGNRTNNGWLGGIFVWDPDHSTFPPNSVTNQMAFFSDSTLTNISTICMSPFPGKRYAMVKGTGRVVRFTEFPTTMVSDYPAGYHTSISTGDSGFDAAGQTCLVVERQGYYPHRVMLFDADGDLFTIEQEVAGAGFTNYGEPITAVEWHPFEPMGLMAGRNRWIFRFAGDPVPSPVTPTPTLTSTPTQEPTATPVPVVPAIGLSGLILLELVLGLFISIPIRNKRPN
ncbi:hypothetical protein JXA80_02800 [bacterium]|nr:hypothetical protein [candidate division CSSED10-310 bacterium]